MTNYYVEILDRRGKLGEALWAPNSPVWHWQTLKEMKKGDVVYHFYNHENKRAFVARSVVKEPGRIEPVTDEIKRSFPEYDGVEQLIVVRLEGYEKLDEPVVFDREFYDKLAGLEYDPRKGPFTKVTPIHLNQVYCVPLDPALKDFLDHYHAKLATTTDNVGLDPHPKVSKQIILYGPPGTGKTWRTRLLACRIIGDQV